MSFSALSPGWSRWVPWWELGCPLTASSLVLQECRDASRPGGHYSPYAAAMIRPRLAGSKNSCTGTV